MRRFRQRLALPENVLPAKLAVRIAFPRHVAAVRHAEVGAKQLSVIAEQIVDLSLAPNIERPLGLRAISDFRYRIPERMTARLSGFQDSGH